MGKHNDKVFQLIWINNSIERALRQLRILIKMITSEYLLNLIAQKLIVISMLICMFKNINIYTIAYVLSTLLTALSSYICLFIYLYAQKYISFNSITTPRSGCCYKGRRQKKGTEKLSDLCKILRSETVGDSNLVSLVLRLFLKNLTIQPLPFIWNE